MNQTRLKILTIEDETILRQTLAAYLEDSGYEVLEAENGKIGLELFRTHHPDLILCDLRMPEVDGLQVLSEVRLESPETPVIVVSGLGTLGDVIEALHRGAWDYILKPIVEFGVLEHAIFKALERARLLRENRSYQEHLEEQIKLRTQELEKRSLELQEANYNLQREISERLRMEEELIRAQKFESLAAFADGLAHEFNNILTSVIGYISLSRHHIEPGSKPAELLTTAENAAFKARDLTQQLLGFSRQSSLNKVQLSLAQIINDACKPGSETQGSIRQPTIVSDLWDIEGDLTQISQVFQTLLHFCKDHGSPANQIDIDARNQIIGKALRIDLPVAMPPGRYVDIRICASGVDIPQENQHKFFDPYFSSRIKSSGLGLSLAYTVIRKHNGFIFIDSLPGQGTVLQLFFPALQSG